MTVPARTLRDIDGSPIPRGKVSRRLEQAIRLIEEGGYAIALAAEATGYKPNSLAAALVKPHVRAFRSDVKRAHRLSESSKSWNRIVDLAENADSEKVKLEANKTLLSALGELQPDDDGKPKGNAPLIQFIRQEVHNHAHPLTQRLPGVYQTHDVIDVDHTPLDSAPSLTPQDGG